MLNVLENLDGDKALLGKFAPVFFFFLIPFLGAILILKFLTQWV